MSSVKITYFDAKGRAEPTRLTCQIGGVEFEDERIAGEQFAAMKKDGRAPFGSLPTLTLDGEIYAQSNAMLRYCGKRAGLYPKDAKDALLVDQIVDVIDDLIVVIFKDNSEKARTAFVNDTIPRYFAPVDKMFTKHDGAFLLGDKLSIADVKMFVLVTSLKSGIIDHVPADVVDKYTNLMKSYDAVRMHEKVLQWYAKKA